MVLKRALQGAVLALGAPLGWLLVQLLLGTRPRDALAGAPLLHAYLLIGSLFAFTLFGYRLGVAEQRLGLSNERLRQLSITDPLTGLANRRYFDARLEEACADAVRHRRPLSLVIADLDHFKAVNDRFGHPAGDRVLKAVGSAVAAAARSSDTAARIGGEELALVLPDTSLAEARVLAARLVGAIRGLTVPLPAGSSVRITASAGIAQLGLDSEGAVGLFNAADAALYRAKEEGRDCVSA